MIELRNDRLIFSFPEVHPGASLTVSLQRTLRIPDDGKTYPLPPGLGDFPLRHVDDFSNRVPQTWIQHGGVMLPMYQSEAMWLYFSPSMISNQAQYPFAIRVLTGKIDAVTGETYEPGLQQKGSRVGAQNYLVSPGQPWLDGYSVEKGVVRQFVAMPLGEGYTAEEQITGEGVHGGIQLVVYPMKREAFEERFPVREQFMLGARRGSSMMGQLARCREAEMGIAPGGKIKQEIYQDRFDLSEWEENVSSRCFIHIANSQVWQQITRSAPPVKPPTAKQYSQAGLPWFDYYDENLEALDSQEPLERLLSVSQIANLCSKPKHVKEPDSCDPETIITYRKALKKDQVREGKF